MANRFYINPPNPLEALMTGVQGYEGAQKRAKQGEMDAGRAAAVQALQTGGDTRGALARLIGVGDIQGANAISQYAESQANRSFRESEAQRAQSNADRSFGLQQQQFNVQRADVEHRRALEPWQVADGKISPKPGGPADPAYIHSTTEAKAKPRDFSVSDVTKLSDEGGKFSNLTSFADTFQPSYAGYGAKAVGDVATAYGRYAPAAITPENTAKAAQWWQGYDRFKNVVRNDLFGSALTKPEVAAFEKADINPGMEPGQVAANLKIQKEIAQNGLKRKANALIQSGYKPEAIAAAYGLRLEDIGVGPKGSAPAQAAQPSAPAQTAPRTTKTGVTWSIE